jgi:hypothetical protein
MFARPALSSAFMVKNALKILPRISVPGISMSVCVCVRVVVDGSLDLSAQATVLFIRLGHNWRCFKVCLATTDESGQRRVRCWLLFCAFFAAILWVQRVATHRLLID